MSAASRSDQLQDPSDQDGADVEADIRDASLADQRLRHTAPVAVRLIDATIEQIDADGEVSVRVHDIVAAVGVQIPVLYRHFGNREGLIQAAQIERLVRDLDHELTHLALAFDAVASAEEFRELFGTLLERIASPGRRSMRWKRVNVIGSAYGRPQLAEAVARMQMRAVTAIAELLEPAQAAGWIRDDLDLPAFAAWFGGQTLGRVLIEVGDTDVDTAAWDAISADAVCHVLFG